MLCLAIPDRCLLDIRALWVPDVPFGTPFDNLFDKPITFGASFGRPFVSTAIEELWAGKPFELLGANLSQN
jgi:hypothetical protein